MASLKDGEVAVDVEFNSRRMGPSGKRARSEDSAYLRVGGSSDAYRVTLNWVSPQGHFCAKEDSGAMCRGNNSKRRKFGNNRSKTNPEYWCKHVKAALADTEAIEEAQALTATAFGKTPATTVRTVAARIKAPVPAFETLADRLEALHAPVVSESPADRLTKLEAEAEAIRESIAAEATAELRTAVAALVAEHGYEAVQDAAKEAM